MAEEEVKAAVSTESEGDSSRPAEGAALVGDGGPVPALKPHLSGKRQSERRVQWNEEIIAEHDKDRGTRQKIDEPPTPFEHSPLSLSEDEDAEAAIAGRAAPSSASARSQAADPQQVAARLEALAATSPSTPPAGEQPAQGEPHGHIAFVGDAAEPGAAGKRSSDAFKAKRAQHYNEFQALKAFNRRTAESSESSGDEAGAKK